MYNGDTSSVIMGITIALPLIADTTFVYISNGHILVKK